MLEVAGTGEVDGTVGEVDTRAGRWSWESSEWRHSIQLCYFSFLEIKKCFQSEKKKKKKSIFIEFSESSYLKNLFSISDFLVL